MDAYKTTLINLTHKDPDLHGFKWVLKILTREMFAFSLDIIKIEKDLVVGTDSHRIHIFYPDGLYPSGTYKVLVKTRTKIILERVYGINYPNWHFVFIKKGTFETIEIGRVDSTGYTKIVRAMNEEQTLNFNYFIDLDSEMLKVSIPDTSKEGVFFENFDATKKALIMPMRT